MAPLPTVFVVEDVASSEGDGGEASHGTVLLEASSLLELPRSQHHGFAPLDLRASSLLRRVAAAAAWSLVAVAGLACSAAYFNGSLPWNLQRIRLRTPNTRSEALLTLLDVAPETDAFALQCSGYVSSIGRLQDRCLAGNALEDGWEYVYNPLCLDAARSLCGPCVCCRRPKSESQWPAEFNPFSCTDYPAEGDTVVERCEGGNLLDDGWLYVYDAFRYSQYEQVPVCNGCACCRRPNAGHVNASLFVLPLANGLPQPHNFIIHCAQDTGRLAQFSRHMQAAGLTFEIFPCFIPTKTNVDAAIRRGLVSSGITKYLDTKPGTIGVALAHITLLAAIAERNIPLANVFEDDEVVPPNYPSERAKILGSLPRDWDYVKLNNLRTTGEPEPGADPRVLRMTAEQPGWTGSNVWLDNYVVTSRGARKLLELVQDFDASTDEIDWYISWRLYEASPPMGGLVAFAVRQLNMLSIHCQATSTKTDFNEDDLESWEMDLWVPEVKQWDQPSVCYIAV